MMLSAILPTWLAIEWTMHPEVFPDTWFPVRWYGLFFATSFLLGYRIMRKMYAQEQLSDELLDKLLIYVMIGTVVGARLGHVFFYDWEYYRNHLVEIPMVWKGGLASHGAAIAIIISLYIYTRRVLDRSLLWMLDRVVVTVALAGFFIRMGNLFNHEIIGVASDVPWAFIFSRAYVPDPLTPRHPAQLYEALCYLIIFGLMFRAFWKTRIAKHEGRLFGWFLVSVFTARFLIEFLKEDQVAFEASMALNMGQWLSIPLVAVGAFFVLRPLPQHK